MISELKKLERMIEWRKNLKDNNMEMCFKCDTVVPLLWFNVSEDVCTECLGYCPISD